MTLPEDNAPLRDDAIRQALRRIQESRDNFQAALDLAEEDPRLSAHIPAIEQAIGNANQVYSSISGTLMAIQSTEGVDRQFPVPPPLKFKKAANPKG